MKENKLFIPFLAFFTTIIMMQSPWFGLLVTVPFVAAASKKIQ